jgi:hypothetical protein
VVSVLKLRLALCLALIVAVLTASVGLAQGVRPLTVLYRTFISLLVFGVGGYLLGCVAESFLTRWLESVKPKGQKVDILSEDGLLSGDELLNPSHAAQPFSPLIPYDFEQISSKD